MKKLEFFVNGPLPGMNEIIAASKKEVRFLRKGRRRVYEYTLMKRDFVARTCLAIGKNRKRGQKFKKPIFVEFTWYEKNKRRDPDNIAAGKKFIFDAFVESQLIENDNMNWICGFSDTFKVNKEIQPGVYVKAYEGR